MTSPSREPEAREALADEDPQVIEVARAIAEHGFGRPWNDFLPLNAHDTDQGDLIEYARAAVAALRQDTAPGAEPVVWQHVEQFHVVRSTPPDKVHADLYRPLSKRHRRTGRG